MATDHPFREDFKDLIVQGVTGKASEPSASGHKSNHQSRPYTKTALDDAAINRLLGIYSESGFRAHFSQVRNDITIVNGGWFIPPYGEDDPLSSTGSYITVGQPNESYKKIYSTISDNYKGELLLLELRDPKISESNYARGMIDKELNELFNLHSFSNGRFYAEENFSRLLNQSKYSPRKTSGLNTGRLSTATEERVTSLIDAIIELDPNPIETMMNRVIIDRFFLAERWKGRISDLDAIIHYDGETFFIDNKLKYPSAELRLGQNKDHYPFFENLSTWPNCRALYVVNIYENKGEIPALEPENWWFADMKRFKTGINVQIRPGKEGSSGTRLPDTILIPKKQNFRRIFREFRKTEDPLGYEID